jgi:F-type H+/Na+-transporting ATPase subunit alpha
VMLIWCGTNGLLDDLPVSAIRAFESQFMMYMHASHADVPRDILAKGTLDDDLIARLTAAVKSFKENFKP